MNKHFRVSGSTFTKLEELEVSASAVLRRVGLPQAHIKGPRVLSTPRNSLRYGVPSERPAPTPPCDCS
jgi:hypothetical protein